MHTVPVAQKLPGPVSVGFPGVKEISHTGFPARNDIVHINDFHVIHKAHVDELTAVDAEVLRVGEKSYVFTLVNR
jgi:hypothetical protein